MLRNVADSNVYLSQSLSYHCHLHSPQTANCYRISRLVVDEDDLKWMTNEENIVLLLQFHENIRSET